MRDSVNQAYLPLLIMWKMKNSFFPWLLLYYDYVVTAYNCAILVVFRHDTIAARCVVYIFFTPDR
jgi:hypothetical protein